MPSFQSTAPPADGEETFAGVSSLRSRFEGKGTPSTIAAASSSTSRVGNRAVSVPVIKEMPTTKAFPAAARSEKEGVEEEEERRTPQRAVGLAVRARGVSSIWL